jgi:hypothetical protein
LYHRNIPVEFFQQNVLRFPFHSQPEIVVDYRQFSVSLKEHLTKTFG